MELISHLMDHSPLMVPAYSPDIEVMAFHSSKHHCQLMAVQTEPKIDRVKEGLKMDSYGAHKLAANYSLLTNSLGCRARASQPVLTLGGNMYTIIVTTYRWA